jgi:hypothetical protein
MLGKVGDCGKRDLRVKCLLARLGEKSKSRHGESA